MDNPAAPAESLNVEQLLHLHTLTKDVARVCQKQLRAYLDTMALLFRPRRILGDAMEGAERESVGGSDRTLAELRDLYRKVAVRPFDLRPELSLPLESVSTQMQLYEWEYLHQIKTDRGWRSIKVTSPLTGSSHVICLAWIAIGLGAVTVALGAGYICLDALGTAPTDAAAIADRKST